MRITRFRIEGFKNIVDISVDGLSDINVFFGLNDVGKSNIFKALALWRRLVTVLRQERIELPIKDFEQTFGANIFSLGGPNSFSVEARIVIENSGILRESARSIFNSPKQHQAETPIWLTGRIHVGAETHRVIIDHEVFFDDEAERVHPANIIRPVHLISAERRFQTEARNGEALSEAIQHGNLKKALFYAYLSADLQQKKRFSAIKSVLAEPPFSLGELDVALDQETDQIDIGFIRPQGRLPLDNLGSGSRQLLLVLGQVFLNNFPVVALEEPEMNLSPQWQQDLMIALRRLMLDPAIGLKQIFISTHSPYFEFTENFYDVTLDESGHTQVKRTTAQDWSAYFAVAPLGPETGARLNSLNQVRLYDRLIEDLDLRRGDMVVFVRNEAGRWELRKAEEIARDLQSATANNGKS